MNNKIIKYRKKIDKLDEKLINLLNKRINLVKKIAVLKNNGNDNIYQPKRELEIKKRNEKLAEKYDLNIKFIDEVFVVIKKYARETQRKRLKDDV